MTSLLPPFPPDLWLPPPRPPPPPPPIDENRILIFRLGMAFAFSLFAVFLCGCCKGYRNSQARAAAAAAAGERPPGPRLQQLEPRAGNGGATNTAARLPAFKYSRSVKHKVTGAGEESATCSVCLGAFQHGESVRLLPACLHLFHVECIDPWLDAHSTCPICRSDTDPTMAVGRLPNV